MNDQIPQPTLIRLCSIVQLLSGLEKEGVQRISSTLLEKKIGVPAHTIRKDISCIGEIGNFGSGYEVVKLKRHIDEALQFGREQKCCVVGLGHLGQAILQLPSLAGTEFRIIAGFDSNINKLETIKTSISLYPSYEISEVVKSKNIELAIIAVPAVSAQEVTDRLVDGGIQGIVNFTAVILKTSVDRVFVRNIDLGVELRIVSVLARRHTANQKLQPLQGA